MSVGVVRGGRQGAGAGAAAAAAFGAGADHGDARTQRHVVRQRVAVDLFVARWRPLLLTPQ